MSDTIRSLATLQTSLADNGSGAITAQVARDVLVSTYRPQAVPPGGRLTLTSATPVTTADVTGASTLYYTPYLHNAIGLYDGTSWTLYQFSEVSLALSGLTSAKNYDVFLYDNAGTLTLELLAWTDDTTRATALVLQDGAYVKTGATTRRYLGTVRTTGTTTTEDSRAKRFVWNASNRASKNLGKTDGTSSWTYSSTTVRQARADATNQVEVVAGLAGAPIDLQVACCTQSSAAGVGVAAIGLDSTTALVADQVGPAHPPLLSGSGAFGSTANRHVAAVPVGYHYYAWIEMATTASTVTFFGDTTSNLRRSGLLGHFQC